MKMKKIAYILSIFLVGLLASCSDDILQWGSDDDPGGPVELNFSVMIPEMQKVETRGLLSEAANEKNANYLGSLKPYIFIFEDTGNPESNYLRSLVYGSQITNEGTSVRDEVHSTEGVDVQIKDFSAVVEGTAENAIIHLVLLHEWEVEEFELQLSQLADRSEVGLFTGATGIMTKSAGYWRRIPLHMPINNTNKVKDDFKKKLSHIQMVRNFAQVTVESKADNFTVLGFEVVNAMDCGYIAAYNENTGVTDNFLDFEGKSYDYLVNNIKYLPTRHPYALRANADNKLDEWLDVATDTPKDGGWSPAPKYMFERPIQDTRMTCILLKGEYTPKGTTATTTGYYKLDIGAYDKDENHQVPGMNTYGVYQLYHLIRNISYDIKITDAASPGHTTAESAIAGPPANNITASVQTRNVLSLGDGVDEIGVTLYTGDQYDNKVDGTTLIIVDQEIKDGSGQVIGYKPYPAQANLTWFYLDGEQTPAKYLNDIECSSTGYELKAGDGCIIKSMEDGWTPMADDWYGRKLQFNDPGDIPLKETVRLYKPFGLSRDITLVLRKRWEFVADKAYGSNIEVYPGTYSFDDGTMPSESLDEVRRLIPGPGNVGSSRGANLTVMFELPADIPQELFPLEFKLEFDRQNVENAYSDHNVVVYGETLFDDDPNSPNVPRVQYIHTVTWDYYNGSGDWNDAGHKIVTAQFQTTTDMLDNNSTQDKEWATTRVRVYNPYFMIGEDDFKRETNPIDPDPNQTVWIWYFGDPGWQNFLQGDSGHKAGTFNELWYNDYSESTHYGQYMGMTFGRGPSNPDYQFQLNTTAPASGYDATLTVRGASKIYKHYEKGWAGLLGSSETYYRRKCYAQIYIEGPNGNRYVQDTNKTSWTNGGNTGITDQVYVAEFGGKEPEDGSTINSWDQLGMPEDYSITFKLNPGETIKWVKLWTEKVNNNDVEELDKSVALYYSIRFELR